MAAATSTTYDALLREIWPQDDIYDLLYENNPLFAMVPKDTTFYEKIRHIAAGYGTTQGVSADFSSAKANKQASVETQFAITPVTYYSLFSIQRLLLKRSQNKKVAIASALERESKMAFKAWKRDMAIFMYGSGGGDFGRLTSSQTLTGATFTPATATQIRNFEKNQTLVLSSDNTGAAGVRQGTLFVTKVNRTPGSELVTVSTNLNAGVPAIAVSDYVFRQGNYNAVFTGVGGWLPAADPTSTAFFGCDRSPDPLRLGGIRVSCTGLSPREGAMKTAKEVHANGGEPTHDFRHPDDYLNLQLELMSAGVLLNTKSPGEDIGKYTFGMPFEGIGYQGPSGVVHCHSDINQTLAVAHVLQMDSWKFATMGEAPYFATEDGSGRILRESDADSYEGRIVGDMQLYCEAPGFNARAAL